MAKDALHRLTFAALTLQLALQAFQFGILRGFVLALSIAANTTRFVGLPLRGGGLPGAVMGRGAVGKDRITAKRTITTARNAVDRNGRIELIRDTFALFFRCRAHKPHQHKEGHHGRHKISVSHFPRPAVVTAANCNLLPFDDDWRGICLPGHPTYPKTHPRPNLQDLDE